jgi:hypothetical protein
MPNQIGVRAVCGFERIGQKGRMVESMLRINAIGESPHLTGQPHTAHRSRAERVTENATDKRSLFPAFGDRGGGIEDGLLAL